MKPAADMMHLKIVSHRPIWPNLLAADASWEAGHVCPQTHGSFGWAEKYDIERRLESALYQVAPISTNWILSYVAEHALVLPRSF